MVYRWPAQIFGAVLWLWWVWVLLSQDGELSHKGSGYPPPMQKPGVKPGFCIGGGSVVLEAWRHLPTREMPPCVRMHAYMLPPVLMR
ncbi:hypothetical protein KM92DES2_11190 [uncultured Desulfovibrio sp.]|uniref:Uncharacterized protein n=1 Tax=uncultured Desulfovibrio sp. TaxID=167968 RepID=A0A212JIP4_9BACT|nr:hypothetical protein KM92DES2_11190 [uncultured Desulfovibrio sp.]